MKRALLAATSLLAWQGLLVEKAQAQDEPTAEASTGGLDAIVVTAQRRSEDLQDAALAITAVSGEEVRRRSISQTEQLASLSPGLQVNTSAGPYATFAIRSVSSLSGNAFADPAVAVNYDGVYLATPTVLHGLYYDLERLEILKGPQGTLYGRNATAGAINVIPRRPEFVNGGSVNAEIGNLNRFNLGGAINLAASDTLALRLAGQRIRRDGYMSDGASDDNGEAVRGSVLFEPTPDLSILISADYAHQGGRGPGATIRKECGLLGQPGSGACFVADPYTGIADLAEQYTSVGQAPPTQDQYIQGDYYGGLVNVNLETSIGAITAIAAYRESQNEYLGTGTSWQLREKQSPRQTSLELRLASTGSGAFQYVVGAYYLDTAIQSRSQSENQSRKLYADSFTNNDGWTWAAFSQASYAVTDKLRLTGGLRYTWERKTTDSARYTLVNTVGPDPVIPETPPVPPSLVVKETASWDEINWKVGLELDAGPRSLIYANVSTGFKAGGFYFGPVGANTYQPEKVTSWVFGTKNRFLDNRLQINAEAFYLDYTNQQVSFVKLVGPSAVLVTENAGKSHAYGVELESELLLGKDTRLGLQGQWINAVYDEFTYNTIAPPSTTTTCSVVPGFTVDCSGNTPARTPDFTLGANIEQGFALANGGRLFADGRVQYKTGFYADTSYQIETLTGDSTRVDLGLGYEAPDNAFTIRAFVNNLTDEVAIANATVNTSYPANRIVANNLLPPRTYGIQLSADF